MSDYIDLYFKKTKANDKIEKKEKKSKKIKILKEKLKILKIKEEIIKKELEFENFNIEKKILLEFKINKEDLDASFFDDFGIHMGNKIEVFPKNKKIPKELMLDIFNIYVDKDKIEEFKNEAPKIYKKLTKYKDKLKVGQFNKYNISKECKEELKEILMNYSLYFLLFYNKKNKKDNIYKLRKTSEGHFGNPDSYLYFNKNKDPISSLQILNLMNYQKKS